MHATATVAPGDLQYPDAHEGQREQTGHEDQIPRGVAQEQRHAGYEQHVQRQYMRALERANEVRIARAELKRRVAAGAADVAELVLECPWEVQSMAVSDLLTSQRRWGQTRCRKLLAQVPLSERKTLGSMTDRQRRTLAALLSGAGRGESPTLAVADRQDTERISPSSDAQRGPTHAPVPRVPREALLTA